MVLAQLVLSHGYCISHVCFHPTMVLAQRKSNTTCNCGVYCFHPTMVLAQHSVVEGVPEPENKFPSHYGSRSTQEWAGGSSRRVRVSIPLWFSLNKSKDHVWSIQGKVSIPLWFSLNSLSTPFSLSSIPVSIPLWFSLNTKIVFWRSWNIVSIPLWFSLNS